MMKNVMILCILTMLYMPYACAQTPRQAKEYLDKVQAAYLDTQKDMWRYMLNVARGMSAKAVEHNRQDLVRALDESVQAVKKIPVEPAYTSLRDSVLFFLNTSKQVLEEDYSKLMQMEDEEMKISDRLQAYLDALLNANQKIYSAYTVTEDARRNFGERNDIILLDRINDYAEKLEETGVALDYYKDLYMILFESYKQEADMLQALKDGDAAAAEQSRQRLLYHAREDLLNARDFGRYEDSDASLKFSLAQLLDFYRDEAENMAPYLIAFHHSKDSTEQAESAYMAKKPQDRTNEDVDTYNKSIAKLNEGADKYNRYMQILSAKRQNLIADWNRDVQQFLNRHIPAY